MTKSASPFDSSLLLRCPTAQKSPLPAGIVMKVMRHIDLRSEDGAVVVDTINSTTRLEADGLDNPSRLISKLNGHTSIAAILEDLNFDESMVQAILLALYECGAIAPVNDQQYLIDSSSVNEHMIALGRSLQSISANQMAFDIEVMPSCQVIGSLIESYHIINAAPAHIGSAIAHCGDDRLRMLFSGYLSEEYWHGPWIGGGLKELLSVRGLTIDDLVPLPATMGYILYLQHLAFSNFPGYALALGITEGDGSISGLLDERDEQWKTILRRNLFPESVVKPFREHELYDISVGHASISGEVFADMPPLNYLSRRNLYRVISQFVNLKMEVYRSVSRFYVRDDVYNVAFIPFQPDE